MNTHHHLHSSKNDIQHRCVTWKMKPWFFSSLMNIEQINRAFQDPGIYGILCIYFLHYSSHNVTQEYLRDDNQAIKDESVQALALLEWIMALSLAAPWLNPRPQGSSGHRWRGHCHDMYFLTHVHMSVLWHPLSTEPSKWVNIISRFFWESKPVIHGGKFCISFPDDHKNFNFCLG